MLTSIPVSTAILVVSIVLFVVMCYKVCTPQPQH